MRRLMLFAVLLSLVGLSSAFAAGFTVQAEEVASFSPEISIPTPTPPISLGPTVYVREDDLPGELALEPPVKNEVERREFVLGPAAVSVQAETDVHRYFTWQTPTALGGGYLLRGHTILHIEQNRAASNRLTAALFDCDASAPPNSSSTALCVQIATANGSLGANSNSNGFQARTADFGTLDHTIPAGHQLRLKIVNRDNVSIEDWDLQWGFAAVAANSRLQIT